MNKQEFENTINMPNELAYSIGRNITIHMAGEYKPYHEIEGATSTPYTKHNAELIKAWLYENKEIVSMWRQQIKIKRIEAEKQHKAWLKTPEGKLSTAKAKALTLAKEAGLTHDEHGGYGRGDYHTLSVQDVVTGKRNLDKLHASGKLLALVEDTRKRIYSKAYMKNFGAGMRSDKYLVGTNENGLPFVHGISKKCETVKDAVEWIWGGNPIISRHGDIAIAKSNLQKSGTSVVDESIFDNHHFTGEIVRNGSIHLRNGRLFHTKEQHPDIEIGNEWVRVVIAKRAVIGGSSD